MKNYLIAGIAGFIGAKVGELLLSEGHNVVGVDTLDNPYDIRLKQARLEQVKHRGLDFIQVDISDTASFVKKLTPYEHFDGIFNLATVEGNRYQEKTWEYADLKTAGVLNLLEWGQQRGVKKYIQSSSASIYGYNPAVVPTPETASCSDLIEFDVISQKTAEGLSYSHHAKHNMDVTVFRYFDVYGPMCNPDGVIFKLCRSIYEKETIAILGDGTQSSGYSYIDDVAWGTIQGLKLSGYEVINLGGHELVPLKKLIVLLEEGIERQAVIEQMESDLSLTITRFPNLQKAKQLLDWTPKVSLIDGILNVIEWYINERHWARFLE
jgi:nucleoside-diphosphate-sugar epimerase